MVRVDLNNKVLIDLDGRVFTNPLPPEIVLEHNQAQFPPAWTGTTGEMSFRTIDSNIIYIDFGDGSPVYSQQFSERIDFAAANPIHAYNEAKNYKVTIWFEFPQKIRLFRLYFTSFIGDFPSQLGLYELESISIHTARFERFPVNFLGGVFNNLWLQNLTMNTINYIPDWITNSKVTQLLLMTSFNLSNLNTSNLDKLVNIDGLERFYTSGCRVGDNSLPSNLKDISTLRILGLGVNPLTKITQEINDCKQISTLIFGIQEGVIGAQTNALFTSWGAGVGGMSNLQRLEWTNILNAPATLPTGIELSPNLKNLIARAVYQTQERIDEFITNAYEFVTDTADITGADNLLRQIYLHLGFVSLQYSENVIRPTGTYQPTAGYEEGVSNGTPETPMEMIYVLVNQYKWTITVINEERTANQVYAP